MNHSNKIGTSILSAAALIALAGPASAAQNDWREIQTEINSCVAAVADHANYGDAARVRHTVVDVKERTVGYKLSIETSIFTESGDAAIREYASSCVINGSNAPMRFEINETNNDA